MKRSIRKKNFILREDHTFPKEVPKRRICVTINSFFFFFFPVGDHFLYSHDLDV